MSSRSILGVLVSCAVLLAPACRSYESVEDLPPELRTMAVVASAHGTGGAVKTPATYGWMRGSGLVTRGVDVSIDADVTRMDLEDMLVTELHAALARHGFSLDARSRVELEIGYLAVLTDAAEATAVDERLGIDPGLAPTSDDAQRYDKGTLILEVARARGGPRVWRGAVQALADLSLDGEIRRERIRQAVEMLVDAIPVEP